MVSGRGGDDEVGLREGVTCLAPFFHHQPPLEHDALADGQHPVVEHRAQLQVEPVVERGTLVCIFDLLDPETDFRKCYRADVQAVQRALSDERHDFWLGLWAPKLGQDVGVEQPALHNATSRTGMASERVMGSSMSWCGEA